MGNLHSWWSEEDEKKFKKKAQCIIDQYGSYVVPGTGNMTVLCESRLSISFKITCEHNEDSYRPAHPPSLIRVFAEHSVGSQGS